MKNLLVRSCMLMAFVISFSFTGFSQTETFVNGSIIVNMGVTPQTVNNALRPYGMIYDLMKNQKIPIKWIINPNKIKDGEDFTYNGKVYKGGPFIIPAGFRNAAVNAILQSWVTSSPGLDLDTVGTTPLTVPVAATLTAIPRWTLDSKNGGIAQGFLTAAGITNAGFSANAYNWKLVTELDCCDDFFVMPHADPTWATHSRLYTWNQQCLGAVWAGCHAVSALENAINPANPAEQMNFLSTRNANTTPTPWPNNSLKLWGTHSGGSVPYTHTRFADPVAQYLGTTDAAQQNGSEQIYIPKQSTDPGGATRWRPETNIVAYDASQVNVPAPDYANGNVAASIAYGRGLGQNDRGYVMYEASHNIGGTGPANIAAQRAFWNFSYFQVLPKAPQVSAFTGPSQGQLVQGNTGIAVSVTANSPVGNPITYSWSSSCGGSFTNGSTSSATFNAPSVGSNTPCIITCTISDGCRQTNYSIPIIITAPPAPPTPQNDVAALSGGCAPGTSVTLNVLTNDTDPQSAPFTFTSLNQGTASPANAGTWSNVGGSVTFVPDANFNGAATITYTVTNSLGGTANATITVNVGTIDVNGCSSNQVYAPSDIGLVTLATGNFVSQSGTTGGVDELSLDDAENIYTDNNVDYVNFGTNVGNNLVLAIGSTSALRAKDTINIFWSKSNTASATISVQIGQSGTGPWTNAQTFTNAIAATGTAANLQSQYIIPGGVSGITHIRINAGTLPSTNSGTNVWVDAVEYEYLTCITRAPQLTNDATTVLEDAPAIINVMANDNDPQGLPLTVSRIVTQPANGKVSINLDGTVTYITSTDIAIATSFVYEACNTQGYCATATVNITVAADGCAPNFYRANPPAGAQTRFFQFGFTGTNAATANSTAANFRDSKLNQASGGNDNYGGDNKIEVGKVFASTQALRPVFQFNISEIPTNAVVQNATFSAYRIGGNNDLQSVNLHGLTADFVENQVTWLIRSTGNNWAPAGGAFGSLVSSANLNGTKTRYNWDVKDLVTTWVATPANNFGLLLKTGETLNKSHQFNTKEIGTIANRPGLSVTYVVPEPCAAITNRAPLAQPDYATTANGQSVAISPLPNDADVDAGNTFTITGVSGITAGSATFTGTTITYTANINATVPRIERLTYTITDNNGATDQAYVYITVTNAPPTSNKDVSSANSGTNQVINVVTGVPASGADVDPEGGSLSAPTITLNPKSGTASFVGNVLTYIPNPGFTGNDTLVYQICEASAGACSPTPFCDTALVVFTVVNQAPVASPDNVNFRACQPLRINLTGNDTDAEGGILTLNIVTPPASGTLVNNNDGTVTFTPAPNSPSPITFTYNLTDNGVTPQISANATVTLTINTSANSAPVASNDIADPQYIGEIVYTNVKDNDSDPDNNPLGPPTITVQPLRGTAIVLANGIIQYTPNPGYYGTDVLTYSICDTIPLDIVTCTMGIGTCVTATVTYTILPPNNTTNAYNDEHSTWQDVNVSSNVLTNDNDLETDAQVLGGYFDKDANLYKTSGTFNVYAEDGITLAGQITVVSNGDFTFDPLPTFSGVVSVPYFISDVVSPSGSKATSTDTALLKITVNPLPVISNSIIANNDEYVLPLNSPDLNSSVTAFNDFDPQGNSFTVTAFTYDNDGDPATPNVAGTVGAPAITIGGVSSTGIATANAGTLIVNADGTFTFNPQNDFTGSIDVVYTITDALGASTTAILHIDIIPDVNGVANDAPFAGDDFKYTNVNTPVSNNALTNDRDPNAGNTIAATSQTTTVPGVGTLVLLANGSYTFTPAQGYTGPATFPYTICDNLGLCTEATLHFLVGIDNSTDAVNDETSTWQDVNVSGGVLANDYDAENHTQTFGTFLAQGAVPGAPITTGATLSGVDKTGSPVVNAGVLTFADDGTYTFDPDPAFTGTVSVPYRLCDNGNLSKCDTAYLLITVDPLPTTGLNSVIANNDENVSYGSPVGGSLFVNDRDPQADAFTVTAVNGVPANVGATIVVAGTDLNGNTVANAGTLTINANGSYTYTPATGFVGSINFPYTITDADGATSTAILHIDVLKDPNGLRNDPPFAGDDFGYTTINKPVLGNFISNDSDPNGDPVSYMGVTIVPAGPATPIGGPVATAQGGTVQFYANGTYLYTPPAGYIGPDRLPYTICDVTVVAPQPLCADATIHLLVGPGINISGKVWNDANGNVIDPGATEPETNAGGTLYVNLIDGSGNVVATTPVAAITGAYSFTDVNPGSNYTIQLSTNQGVVPQPAPATQLPATWDNTGETRNGTIDLGTLGIIDNRAYGFTNTVNFDFGIERLPESDNKSQLVSPTAAGNIIAGSVTTAVSGLDAEDGVLGNSNTIVITALPANATMFYNGIAVAVNQTITNFNPTLLSFTGITLGSSSVVFNYAFLDAALKQDPTPATYQLTWSTPLPVTGLEAKAKMIDFEKVAVEWKTETELNSDYFEVERSTDNVNFTIVGKVTAAGTSYTTRNYTFDDNIATLVQQRIIYYRIRQVDNDGKYVFSNIVTVRKTNNLFVTAYPNPFASAVLINITSNLLTSIDIRVTDVAGRTLMQQKNEILRGNNQVRIQNLEKLPGGTYLLEVINRAENNTTIIKLIKQ